MGRCPSSVSIIAPLVDGELIDTHVVELAEFGAGG